MGTWSVDAFGNDDAADWAFELAKSDDLSLVEAAINGALTGSDYLDAADAAIALAAIEVIARLNGNWGDRNAYTEPVDAWIAQVNVQPEPELLARARAAIDRILSEDSEMLELWQDSGDYEAWLGSVENLRSRLGE
ncbi:MULTISPECIES: DUF4259 domain-containing protein [Cyanophyceae]|uniref:DUF4259 domain-containing protein n=1 Tax=Cyanophyceae TaxID=3028117 RepID=UPI00168A294B|nr:MULTISPECIES: DUF4259 domain-containing protein [Cyanophyceae]MBD1917532.1 DUF4259 domain-containing protein [Phormidium sp. FACHB-77]MBD2029593.1 DUF4259 domain-containing protein [Phormidium sp. FACHB-322]MBD2050854.1 DUF4259 domain-containing protein [Leptolyngbya sp. FACHB-60]